MPMDDIPWSKRSLAVLIEEGMLDEMTAGIAEDWVKKYSLQKSAQLRHVSDRTVSEYRHKIRVIYDRIAVYADLPPRRVK